MPETSHIDAKSGDVLLLVGTMKGAFLLNSNADRTDWTVGGPYFPGRAIYALHHDQRNGRNRVWAAVNRLAPPSRLKSRSAALKPVTF